jgi:TolB protein
MGADGSGETNLTNDPEAATLGTWSPDGTKIAFVSNRDDTTEIYNSEIYVMNADGTGQSRLTNDPHSDEGPIWSR